MLQSIKSATQKFFQVGLQGYLVPIALRNQVEF